jgi:RNase H-fold protein (predicted Holliday junction resolvase)
MLTANLSRARRAELVDRLAAAQILQEALDLRK